MLAVTNVMVRPILIFTEVLSCQIIGWGSMSIITSVIIFINEDQRYHTFRLRQWPLGMFRSQRNFSGTQIKNPMVTMIRKFAIIRAPKTQHMTRSLRLVNMRRNSTKMANFGRITASRYTMAMMSENFAQVVSLEGSLAASVAW